MIHRLDDTPQGRRFNSRPSTGPLRTRFFEKRDRMSSMIIVLLLALQLGTPPVYDRVILGGHVMDPASGLDAVSNIGLAGGRIALITSEAIRGRDTVDARGLVVAPGFIDVHARGQTPDT